LFGDWVLYVRRAFNGWLVRRSSGSALLGIGHQSDKAGIAAEGPEVRLLLNLQINTRVESMINGLS
jgi:hypothetical protein